jgi:hypothetical protein
MDVRYRQGQHICCVYETEDEQIAEAARYLADGLQAGERCLYAGYTTASLDRFRLSLGGRGIDGDEAVARGALLERTSDNAHLVGGAFDSERMLATLNDTLEAALNDGYTGLRTCGDMTWLLDNAPGSDQVFEYEALLTEFFQHVRASGMCQYNRRRLRADLVDHALVTHATVTLCDGQHRRNPFSVPSLHALTRQRGTIDDVLRKLDTLGAEERN